MSGAGSNIASEAFMSSYRDDGNGFDPNAYPAYGPPLRPYNKVQWCGAALILLGLVLDGVYFAGRLGWTHAWVDSPALAMAPLILGAILVNSRRQIVEGQTRTPSRRSLVIIAWALAALALALTAFLYFQGA